MTGDERAVGQESVSQCMRRAESCCSGSRVCPSCWALIAEEGLFMRSTLVDGVAAVIFLASASVARADHTHVLILPNGNCAILARTA